MKLRIVLAFAVLAGLLLAAGCNAMPRNAPVIPPIGWVYTNYRAPLETDFDGDDFVKDSRVGSATVHYLMIPFFPVNIDIAWGEAGIREAAEDANITTVHGADYRFMQVIGLYAETTVYAYGD